MSSQQEEDDVSYQSSSSSTKGNVPNINSTNTNNDNDNDNENDNDNKNHNIDIGTDNDIEKDDNDYRSSNNSNISNVSNSNKNDIDSNNNEKDDTYRPSSSINSSNNSIDNNNIMISNDNNRGTRKTYPKVSIFDRLAKCETVASSKLKEREEKPPLTKKQELEARVKAGRSKASFVSHRVVSKKVDVFGRLAEQETKQRVYRQKALEESHAQMRSPKVSHDGGSYDDGSFSGSVFDRLVGTDTESRKMFLEEELYARKEQQVKKQQEKQLQIRRNKPRSSSFASNEGESRPRSYSFASHDGESHGSGNKSSSKSVFDRLVGTDTESRKRALEEERNARKEQQVKKQQEKQLQIRRNKPRSSSFASNEGESRPRSYSFASHDGEHRSSVSKSSSKSVFDRLVGTDTESRRRFLEEEWNARKEQQLKKQQEKQCMRPNNPRSSSLSRITGTKTSPPSPKPKQYGRRLSLPRGGLSNVKDFDELIDSPTGRNATSMKLHHQKRQNQQRLLKQQQQRSIFERLAACETRSSLLNEDAYVGVISPPLTPASTPLSPYRSPLPSGSDSSSRKKRIKSRDLNQSPRSRSMILSPSNVPRNHNNNVVTSGHHHHHFRSNSTDESRVGSGIDQQEQQEHTRGRRRPSVYDRLTKNTGTESWGHHQRSVRSLSPANSPVSPSNHFPPSPIPRGRSIISSLKSARSMSSVVRNTDLVPVVNYSDDSESVTDHSGNQKSPVGRINAMRRGVEGRKQKLLARRGVKGKMEMKESETRSDRNKIVDQNEVDVDLSEGVGNMRINGSERAMMVKQKSVSLNNDAASSRKTNRAMNSLEGNINFDSEISYESDVASHDDGTDTGNINLGPGKNGIDDAVKGSSCGKDKQGVSNTVGKEASNTIGIEKGPSTVNDNICDIIDEKETGFEIKLKENTQAYEEGIAAKIKASYEAKAVAGNTARIKAEGEAQAAREEIARIKAEFEAKSVTEEAARIKAEYEAKSAMEEAARVKAEYETKAAVEEANRIKVLSEDKSIAMAAAATVIEDADKVKIQREAKAADDEAIRIKAEDDRTRANEEAHILAVEQETAKIRIKYEVRAAEEVKARIRAEYEAKSAMEAVAKMKKELEAKTVIEEAARMKAQCEAKTAVAEATRIKAEYEAKTLAASTERVREIEMSKIASENALKDIAEREVKAVSEARLKVEKEVTSIKAEYMTKTAMTAEARIRTAYSAKALAESAARVKKLEDSRAKITAERALKVENEAQRLKKEKDEKEKIAERNLLSKLKNYDEEIIVGNVDLQKIEEKGSKYSANEESRTKVGGETIDSTHVVESKSGTDNHLSPLKERTVGHRETDEVDDAMNDFFSGV